MKRRERGTSAALVAMLLCSAGTSAAAPAGVESLPPCQAAVNCQVLGDLNAFNSTTHADPNPDEWLLADDFTPAQSGAVASVCWQGVYTPGAVTDSFMVRYFSDAGGLPGALLAQYSASANTLQNVIRVDTGADLAGTTLNIYQYTATHAPLPVTADTCYWIEISNELGAAPNWYWMWAEEGRNQSQPANPLPREGNGRMMADGNPPDGYDVTDLVAGVDLAFCLGVELQTPACGFETLFDTGPHEALLFNGMSLHLGFSAGNAGPSSPQGRNAEAFAMPALPAGSGADVWTIEQLAVECFGPSSPVVNQFINFEIFSRTALDDPPGPADSLYQIFDVPFDAGSNIDPVTEEVILLLPPGAVTLPPGDYWLTMFASNNVVPFTPSSIAWFTNAPDGINVLCTQGFPPPPPGCTGTPPCNVLPPLSPITWRAASYPVPGFCPFAGAPGTIAPDPVHDPTPDPADLLNTAFRMRGHAFGPPAPCPWDCGDGNGAVGIVDFLAMLSQWAQAGAPCDFDGGGVGITDFLALLGNWGNCPP